MQLLIILMLGLFVWEIGCYLFAPKKSFGNTSGMLFAKFTPGAIVSEIRNKIAATVYSKNGAGAVIRNRVTPINRRSAGQTNARQILASYASGWRGITQSQRDAWNAAASNFPQTDSLGQTVILTGEQLYVRLNANLTLTGGTPITSPPIPTSFAVLTPGAVTLSAAAFTVAFTPDPVPTGFNLVIRATAPRSAGKSFFAASEFRFIQSEAAASASPADLDTAYELIFGDKTGQVGQKVGIEMFLMETATGLTGVPVRTTALIA